MKRVVILLITVISLLVFSSCEKSTVFVDIADVSDFKVQFAEMSELFGRDIDGANKLLKTDDAEYVERVSPTIQGASQRLVFVNVVVCDYKAKAEVKFVDNSCVEVAFIFDSEDQSDLKDVLLEALNSSFDEPDNALFTEADEVFAQMWIEKDYVVYLEDYYNPPPGATADGKYVRIRLKPYSREPAGSDICECGEKIVFYTSYIIDDYEKIGTCPYVSDDDHYHAEEMKYAYCHYCEANYLSPVPYNEIEFCSLTLSATEHPINQN